MQVIQQILAGILGHRFPTGLLVLTGWLMVWTNTRLGLSMIVLAVAWSFAHEGILAYGSTDRQPRPTVLKYIVLLVLWCLVVYGSFQYLL